MTRLPAVFAQRRFTEAAGLLLFLLCFIVVSMINVFPFLGGQQELLDFGSFYASGLKLASGENPYDPDSPYILSIDFPRVGAGGKMINLNPPITAMIFASIAGSDPQRALRIWQVISAFMFTCLIFGLAAQYPHTTTPARFLWAFMLAGFWQTLTLGQVYIALLVFVIAGWILLQRQHSALAGIAIGLAIAVKPNLMVWPLFLLAAGYAIPGLVAMLTGALVSAIPALAYGPGMYRQWLEASALQPGTLILPGNSSLVGLGARFESIPAGIIFSAVLALGLLYAVRRKSRTEQIPLEGASALGIILSILASPIAWVGYTLFLLPVYFGQREWSPTFLLSAAILSFPFAFVLKLWQDSPVEFVLFGWFYGWGLLCLLWGVVRNTIITSSIQTN